MKVADREYVLANADHEAELSRIRLLEEVWDGLAVRRLADVGVQRGWRCLEAGAGGGSIARLLSDLVGATGTVIAADINTRFLEEIGSPNVEVRRLDVRTDDVGSGYDLVHTRMLLSHLPDPVGVARKLIASLRPGGTFVFEEFDLTRSLPVGDPGPHAAGASRIMGLICHVAREHVLFHPDGGTKVAAALGDARAEVYGEVFRGGSPAATWHARSYEAARSVVVGDGLATDEEYDELRTCLADPRQAFEGLRLFGVVGQRTA
jgi:SAM-dependent methyltransferase